MKNPVMFLLVVCLAMPVAYGQYPEQIVSSRLQEATLFFNGAQLSRTASTRIPAGITELVFSELSTDIDPASIQVNGRGNFTILSVSHRSNFLEHPIQGQQQRILQDSLDMLNRQLALNRALQKNLQDEEAFLLANKSIGGSETGVKVSELRAAADFLRERLGDIKRQHLAFQDQIQRDQERVSRIQQQLGHLSNIRRQPVGQVVVQVAAEAPSTAAFNLKYLVRKAGWTPSYDIRVNDTSSPVELVLKAEAFQHTGEDWEQVKLAFSTGNPLQYGQRPVLYPWWIDFPEKIMMDLAAPMSRHVLKEEFAIVDDERDLADHSADYVQQREAQTTREFQISKPYNLRAGGGRQAVELERKQLDAIYEYFVTPKLSTEAFLVARLPHWQDYALMHGEANMFFEGTFLGKTQVNPSSDSDTLELSLGRDPNILVQRERISGFSRRNLMGNRTSETIGWEISLRNNKNTPIMISLLDQVPVSTRQEIRVNIDESSGAVIDQERGLVSWRMNIEPGSQRKLNLKYSVSYPRNQQLVLE